MSRSFRRLFLSFGGRISRSSLWLGGITAGGTFVVLFVFLENVLGRGATLALYPPFLWAFLALTVKRLHDRGQSARTLLWVLLPILGPLWLFFGLAFRPGTPGENQYGPDPLTFNADYLTVQIAK